MTSEEGVRPPLLLPLEQVSSTGSSSTTTTMTSSTASSATSSATSSTTSTATTSAGGADEKHEVADLGPTIVEILEQPEPMLGFDGSSSISACVRVRYPHVSPQLEAVLVLSCVTAAAPFRAHPNRLSRKQGGSERGVISATFKGDGNEISCKFDALTISRARDEKEAAISLAERKAINVDPFQNGFAHNIRDNDLGQVRICFQAFLRTSEGGTLRALRPVVSDIISEPPRTEGSSSSTKASITALSTRVFKASGNEMVTLSCGLHPPSRLDDMLEIWLEEESESMELKEIVVAYLSSVSKDKLTFMTPPYRHPRIERPVKMSLSLFRPRDRKQSSTVEVQYVPDRITMLPPPLLRVHNEGHVIHPAAKDYHMDRLLRPTAVEQPTLSSPLSLLSLLAQERQDRARVEAEKQSLARQVHELRANLREAVGGRDNLLWLIDQKERQNRELEARLKETMPASTGRPRLDEISERMAHRAAKARFSLRKRGSPREEESNSDDHSTATNKKRRKGGDSP